MISTTGLPVTYHFCSMLQEKSLDECNVCMSEENPENYSCCALENEISNVIIKSEYSACCQVEFSFNKVEDSFVTLKTELKNIQNFDYIFLQENILSTKSNFSNIKEYNDTSPPFLITTDLYLNNSVLLI